MTEQLTIRGLVATTPKNVVTESGLAVTSFRLAAPSRRFSVEDNAWVTDQTNWYTVSAFRQLAQNSASSISKGDRVLVHGRLKIRDWDNGEPSGTAVELDADAIGFDLTFGTATMQRTPLPADEESEAELQPA